jgi:hypothetical protein
MIVTCHWSATGPSRLRDYHVEFALTGLITSSMRGELLRAQHAGEVDWASLKFAFAVYKNVDLETPTDYGTWHMNHDPRDGSANVEIGALCMGGEDVHVAGPWGAYPYTIAHAWMHAGIVARICVLKHIDAGGSFTPPDGFQNGPIYNVSTHGERALQTRDADAVVRPSFGYFAYSGDGDCRWDIAARDESEAHVLATPDGARSSAIATAAWIRARAHEIKAAGITDFWGLDGAPS